MQTFGHTKILRNWKEVKVKPTNTPIMLSEKGLISEQRFKKIHVQYQS